MCNKRVGAVTEVNDVLQCSRCEKTLHGKCHAPPLQSNLVKRFEWECSDCKVCKECARSDEENKIIICEMCDQSAHIHCLDPPLKEVPVYAWYCQSCVSCNFCAKKLQPLNNAKEGHWLDGVDRLCSQCFSTYNKDGDFCGLCKEKYEGDFVLCDGCERWHCQPCAGFTDQ